MEYIWAALAPIGAPLVLLLNPYVMIPAFGAALVGLNVVSVATSGEFFGFQVVATAAGVSILWRWRGELRRLEAEISEERRDFEIIERARYEAELKAILEMKPKLDALRKTRLIAVEELYEYAS